MTIEIAKEATDEIVTALNHLLPQLTKNAEHLSLKSAKTIINAEGTSIFFARDTQNSIIGTLSLIIFSIPTCKKAFIEDVVVDNNAQGIGAGRALLEAAIEYSKTQEVTRIELSSNPTRIAANKLYLKMRFEVRETNFYRLQI